MIYLDNNATTKPAAEVTAAVREMMEELWGNPSSVHRFGQAVRARVERARESVAGLVGCRAGEVIFTSGGTEANNLALGGVFGAGGGWGVLVTTRVEHSAVRAPASWWSRLGVRVEWAEVESSGVLGSASLVDALEEASGKSAESGAAPPDRPGLAGAGIMPWVVSVQWVNNETGVVQPIAELAAACRSWSERSGRRMLFHVDGTQAVGKMKVDMRSLGIDMLTLAGHKFHGPKGTGALCVRSGVRLRPQMLGGSQERDRRGGTENVPGIVGLGVAAELGRAFVGDAAEVSRLSGMRDGFERAIVAGVGAGAESGPEPPERPGWGGAVVNSAGAERLWNTTNIGFPRLEAEAILLGLSEKGVCASAGAACSSGSLEPSPVLLAIGIPREVAHGSVRFSLSRETTSAELDSAVPIVVGVVRKLRRVMGVG